MTAEHGLTIERHGTGAAVRRFSHEAMATLFEVYVVHPDERYAAQAAHAAFVLVDRLEAELSRFAANSDVSRINQLAAGEATRVTWSTLECLLVARHVFDLTGGAFDPSLGTGLPALHLDSDESMVRATSGGVRLDLGAIGKGYAVDLMAETLEEWGLSAALVHGGFSSVLAMQPPAEDQAWPLTLSDPSHPSQVLTRLSVSQTALGASGLRKGDHIVDPRSGGPIRDRIAAWVAVTRPQPGATATGPRLAAAAVADALTTAFMILTTDEIRTLCGRHQALEAWVLPRSWVRGSEGRGSEGRGSEVRGSEGQQAALLHFGGGRTTPEGSSGNRAF